MKRGVGDDDIRGVGRQDAKEVVIATRLTENEGLGRMPNDAGAVDDGDGADGAQRGPSSDKRRSPFGITSRRATHSTTMKCELAQ